MAGHSKWAQIKRKKAVNDAKRGQHFTKLIREITVAARSGGGDPAMNPRLRLAIDTAKAANMPAENIDRAVKKGTGELEGVDYQPVTYEGYAPHGVALLVECLTDNRNRTGGEIRALFTKNGGSLAEPGAVAWQFTRTGVVYLSKSVAEDDLMAVALDAGADDIIDEGDAWRVTCPPSDLPAVRAALEEAAVPFESADVVMLASTSVPLETAEAAKAVLRLVDLLDDHDDVESVSSNFEIPDAILQAVEV
jgi:YebC/PmpR family DNA-binding regulatory protein